MWSRQQEPKVGQKKADSIYQRFVELDEQREINLQRLKVEKISEENAECLFRPDLANRNRIDKNAVELHNRVDQILKDRSENISRMKIQEMQFKEEILKNQCTFQPKINKENTAAKLKNKVADIDAWKKKIQDKLFEEYFDNN